VSSSGLIDKYRSKFVDSTFAPARVVIYTRTSDDFEYQPFNCFVGNGQFNQDEKEKLEDYQSFGSLKLTQKPQVNDTVLYDGETFKVQRYTKMGKLFIVYGRISRHSGRPKK